MPGSKSTSKTTHGAVRDVQITGVFVTTYVTLGYFHNPWAEERKISYRR